MIIALASPGIASTLDEGLDKIKRFVSDASVQGAEIVCFPEAYLPGLRGQDFDVVLFDQTQQERVLQTVAQWARTYRVATILGMERLTEAGRQIVACVIDARGQMQGYQTKNQLDPTEDHFYVPGHSRQLFEINGMDMGKRAYWYKLSTLRKQPVCLPHDTHPSVIKNADGSERPNLRMS